VTDAAESPGTLWIVATPIGSLGDLAPRAAEVLRTVEVILAEDTRRARALLAHLGVAARGRLQSLHEHNEEARVAATVAALAAGRSAALVSDAGTPVLSDPGFPLVRAVRAAGLPVASLPGASAFTAALGAMKMREEIDAMRVLGLDPIELLVLPRVLALLIMLPVLGFMASIAGLLGGALMAWIDLGISPAMFRTQLAANTSVTHAFVGLSKAPVFAMIIAVVGSYQGLQVAGNTDSLGSHTSRSVVVAIFLVIVVDAVASIFFSVWGV